jgi:hypothetical protein
MNFIFMKCENDEIKFLKKKILTRLRGSLLSIIAHTAAKINFDNYLIAPQAREEFHLEKYFSSSSVVAMCEQ